jgi:hypothetical protein
MDTQNKILPEFLRSLAFDIENDKLNNSQLRSIGEFYVSYLFNEDNDYEELPITDEEDISDKDFKKFLALGWYIYNKIVIDEKILEK